jgi:hypothetical protein
LFLVAIVLAGWPMCLMMARSDEPEKPKPPVIPADKLTPVVPDQSLAFQAITDRTPIRARESTAYAMLLQRVRETSANELARQARHDLFYTHFWERPEKYRGVPVHLTGTAKKIVSYEVEPSMSPTKRLYDVWFYSDENRSMPYVVVIQDPPPGLTVGAEVEQRVTVDGYFMKLLAYQAGDHLRAAPMLVGRMQWTPAPAPTPSIMTELRKIPKRDLLIGVLMLLLASLTVRIYFQVQRARRLARPRSSLTSPGEDPLPPEHFDDWLQNLPDDAEDGQQVRR